MPFGGQALTGGACGGTLSRVARGEENHAGVTSHRQQHIWRHPTGGARERGVLSGPAGGVRGARALEGYPLLTEPGRDITRGELSVGSRSVFAGAGFEQVSQPTLRRVVMRIDF